LGFISRVPTGEGSIGVREEASVCPSRYFAAAGRIPGERELHKTLRQAKLGSLAASRALQIDGVKAAARALDAIIEAEPLAERFEDRAQFGPLFIIRTGSWSVNVFG
jgi:hypothetical protein